MKTIPLLLLLAAAPAAAQDTWSWSKPVAAGKTVEIKGIIGSISAEPASGPNVEVVARKRAERGDPDEVKIEVVEHADGVTICAIYPSSGTRDNECGAGSDGHSSNRNNDTDVRFDVKVPRGVRFSGRTVVGDVTVRGMTADVEGSSVTGNVDVETTELAQASSVSGSVRAKLGRADWRDDLSFSTVSGDITLVLPAQLNTEVHASLLSGGIESEWPLTVDYRMVGKRVRGTIGSGGRELHLRTVSGDIELRKAN